MLDRPCSTPWYRDFTWDGIRQDMENLYIYIYVIISVYYTYTYSDQSTEIIDPSKLMDHLGSNFKASKIFSNNHSCVQASCQSLAQSLWCLAVTGPEGYTIPRNCMSVHSLSMCKISTMSLAVPIRTSKHRPFKAESTSNYKPKINQISSNPISAFFFSAL